MTEIRAVTTLPLVSLALQNQEADQAVPAERRRSVRVIRRPRHDGAEPGLVLVIPTPELSKLLPQNDIERHHRAPDFVALRSEPVEKETEIEESGLHEVDSLFAVQLDVPAREKLPQEVVRNAGLPAFALRLALHYINDRRTLDRNPVRTDGGEELANGILRRAGRPDDLRGVRDGEQDIGPILEGPQKPFPQTSPVLGERHDRPVVQVDGQPPDGHTHRHCVRILRDHFNHLGASVRSDHRRTGSERDQSAVLGATGRRRGRRDRQIS